MKQHEGRHDGRHLERDELRDAVLAADDTGMVRDEADIVTAELHETVEISPAETGAPDEAPP
jgi:hypothetical protein